VSVTSERTQLASSQHLCPMFAAFGVEPMSGRHRSLETGGPGSAGFVESCLGRYWRVKGRTLVALGWSCLFTRQNMNHMWMASFSQQGGVTPRRSPQSFCQVSVFLHFALPNQKRIYLLQQKHIVSFSPSLARVSKCSFEDRSGIASEVCQYGWTYDGAVVWGPFGLLPVGSGRDDQCISMV
jgi:hypothetical protein